MDNIIKRKILQSVVGISVAVVLFFCAGLKLPVLDYKTESYFQNSITKAGLAYATCRAINASVSIIKESSLQLEPAGVGVSLAVGQALDPIDDMTERLSDVLVMAITSLGVQKLAYEIGVSIVPKILSICLVLLSILIWLENIRFRILQKTILRIVLFVAVFRFCLPLSSLVNEFVHKHYFSAQISEARDELVAGSKGFEKLNKFSLPKIDGVLGTIENSTEFVKQKSKEFKNAVDLAVKNIGGIIDSLLTLTFLYVGVFLMQIIMLPLLSFWLLVKIIDSFSISPIPLENK